MIDEKPDLKNFQLLPFPGENSTSTLQKFDLNHTSELTDEVEIVVECEDVKPNVNLSSVQKMDDYSSSSLRNMKDSDYCYKTQYIIKLETTDEVKQKIIGDVTEELNSNFDGELVERNEKIKKLNYDHNLKTYIGISHARPVCGKILKRKDILKQHIDTVHNKIAHECDICGNTFSKKGSLKTHIHSKHRGIRHACDICGKTFAYKESVKIHIDTAHNTIAHACDIFGKNYSTKSKLKIHIDSMHKGLTQSCKTCEKKFAATSDLQRHIDSVHNKITHKCDTCEKNFTQKSHLKIHIESVHNGIKYICDICGKKLSIKSDLKRHIDSVHKGLTQSCKTCEKKFATTSDLRRHIDSVHNKITYYKCDICAGRNSKVRFTSNVTSIQCIMVSNIHAIYAKRNSVRRNILNATLIRSITHVLQRTNERV